MQRRVSNYKPQQIRRPNQLSQPKRIWRNFARRVNWRLVRKIALAGLLVVVLVQIFFPSGRVLPRVKIADASYGWRSTDQLTDAIQQQFEKSSAKLVADDQTQVVKLSELGASIDASKLAEQTNRYDFWWRLVPFSIFFVGGLLTDLQPTFDDGTLSKASDALAQSMTIKEAKSGSITINDQNEIIIEAAQDAVDVESSSVQKAVRQASFKIGTTTELKVESKSSKPAVSNDAIKEVKSKLLAMSSRKITITNSLTKEVSLPNSTDILAWLNVDENTEVSFDEEAIKNYLIKIAGDSVIAAGTTKVVTMDGKETSRTTGKDGRTVDSDPASLKSKKPWKKRLTRS